MEVLFVLLVLLKLSDATIDNVGSCKELTTVAKEMDFEKFAMENGGIWKFQCVPDTDFTKTIEKMWLVNKPTKEKGVYDTTLYYKTKCGEVKVFINEKISDYSCGQATATAKDSNGKVIKFKLTFIKYVPGKYAYYYICSCDGGDKTTDYRYVVVHDALCDEEVKELINKDKEQCFLNSPLKTISV